MSLYYIVSFPIVSLISFGIGLFVLSRNIKSRLNVAFSLFAFSVSVWGFFYTFFCFADNNSQALFWDRWLMAGAIFVPAAFMHFVLVHMELDNKYNFMIVINYVIGLFFLIFLPTPLFIKDIAPLYEFRFWPEPGIVFHPYFLWFALNVTIAHFLLLNGLARFKGLKREQIKYVFWGMLIAFSGGSTNFFLWYKLPIPPVGSPLVAMYVILIAYAITKEELMDIKVVITRTAAYGAVGALLVASFVGLNALAMPQLLSMAANAALALFWAFSASRLREFIQTPLEEKWITGWYNSDKLINGIAQKLVPVIEKKKVFDIISEELKNVIKIKDIHIFIGKPETAHSDIIQGKDGLVIPLSSSDGMEGTITLSQKISEDSYNERDLTLFRTIIIQAMAIFDRIRPYEKIKHEFEANQQKLMEAQVQLERAQRLSSLGRIISEVAHEIRNPMAVIYSKADRIKSNLNDPEYLLEASNLILERCGHIDSIISTMRALSLPPKYDPIELDLRDPIENSLKFMPAKLNIIIKKEFNNAPHIMGDKNELERVFINLFANAYDAMSEKGGALTVRLREEGGHVKAEIEDTGCGISKEDLPEIFEPFFSTKFGKINDRMGFGLSIVHDIIVEKHKGTITAESEQGKGTKFIITLPAKTVSSATILYSGNTR